VTLEAHTQPDLAPGSLVKVRGRDWVVLPFGDDPEVLRLRPLGGSEEDACGIHLPLEGADVCLATLPPPSPADRGDAVSGRLLRDAVRLGIRSAAGPLRCLGRVAVEPRAFQLVPLLMALRQETVRLAIADDVGLGKTIEALLIARELYDRGEIQRVAVLCPPQLCEQWQREMSAKFHFDAVVVRPGTIGALRRGMVREGLDALTTSTFEAYPFTVVSIDFIKSEMHRADFVRACPELVIVDEAHAVSEPSARTGAQHQRHALVAELAADPARHLIFTTATPHSGDQGAFASLIGLLAPDLREAIAAGAISAGTRERARLARHFVQRRRADVRRYLDEDSAFPDRETGERTYTLSEPYRRLLERIVAYASEQVREAAGLGAFRRRIVWWAALGLLRCASSSPAALAVALRTRAARPDAELDTRAVDQLGAANVLDLPGDVDAEDADREPGADTTSLPVDPQSPLPQAEGTNQDRRRLLDLAREAERLAEADDRKLAAAREIVASFLADGYSPIVFCRYIATAHYVAERLRATLPGVEVAAVTGDLPPEEREERVTRLGERPRRVLVATDCLSEGVNLQRWFDAVLHYDLAWNPTRHEQREGRVDRYGQPRPKVRTVLLYGSNNRVDGVVLEVLIRRAMQIQRDTGVAVPVPADAERVLEAIFDDLFQRPSTDYHQLELFADQERQLGVEWERAADRERTTRTIFAQHAIRPDEVAAEWRRAREALGSGETVGEFLHEACRRLGAVADRNGTLVLDTTALPPPVRARVDLPEPRAHLAFRPEAPDGLYVQRTHPLVEAIGAFLVDGAIVGDPKAPARRAGATRTRAVDRLTVVLLVRGRYTIHESGRDRELLAEEAFYAGYRVADDGPTWLPADEVERLATTAEPAGSVDAAQAEHWLRRVLAQREEIEAALERIAHERADDLRDAHQRVRAATRARGETRVRPVLPFDLLGLYVLLPALAPFPRGKEAG